jgi:hypothetical protein
VGETNGLIVLASEITHDAIPDPRTRPLADGPECFMCGYRIDGPSLGLTIIFADSVPLHTHTSCADGEQVVDLFARYHVAVNAVVARTLEPTFDYKPRVNGAFA